MFLIFKKSAGSFGQLSDDELVGKIKLFNDRRAIAALFERYVHLLYGVCLKYLKDREQSKDAAMEIFEISMEKIPVTDISNFKGWIYTVTKNHCLMKLRKMSSSQRYHEEIIQNLKEEIMESDIPLNLIHENNLNPVADSLESAMTKLKKEQEECIRMMYLENKSYKEIAEMTGYSLKQVKSYIQNGKRNLKIIIMNSNDRK
ncbi:MAG TPA: sigma-70 family RNA polymerase sigma factor [Bacteroidales bacterium]|nr:sigma-70 family RNA polymerase sigma factor [Bacteroidales bacterium]